MARKKPLPYAIVSQAVQGDPEAMETVLAHFRGFIVFLAKRDFTDENGIVHTFVDEAVCSDLQTFLIEKVMKFDMDKHR